MPMTPMAGAPPGGGDEGAVLAEPAPPAPEMPVADAPTATALVPPVAGSVPLAAGHVPPAAALVPPAAGTMRRRRWPQRVLAGVLVLLVAAGGALAGYLYAGGSERDSLRDEVQARIAQQDRLTAQQDRLTADLADVRAELAAAEASRGKAEADLASVTKDRDAKTEELKATAATVSFCRKAVDAGDVFSSSWIDLWNDEIAWLKTDDRATAEELDKHMTEQLDRMYSEQDAFYGQMRFCVLP